MRILFSALGTPGHTFALIPLARAAQSAGHEVRFATTDEVHGVLQAQGLPIETAGLSMREAFGRAAQG